MLGLDTNVVLRYLVRDDEAAFQISQRLLHSIAMSGDTVMIGTPVLLECEWVLRSRYKLPKNQITSLFDGLLSAREVVFDDEAVVETALKNWKGSAADFAECVIVAHYLKAGCGTVATFDKKASVLPGAMLLPT